jgi:hypothetical protein
MRSAEFTASEHSAWLASLRPGDVVAVFEHYGRVFLRTTKIIRRTPSGRIVCQCGATFKRDGYLFGSPVYAHRCLRPVLATNEPPPHGCGHMQGRGAA